MRAATPASEMVSSCEPEPPEAPIAPLILPPTTSGLLIEDDSATAQSIELMLKSESFNFYTTDLGEEGVDLGKLYDYEVVSQFEI